MSADTLPVDERRLAAATKRAYTAAGGLKVCEAETGISDTQLSRCSSNFHSNSLSIRNAVRVDALAGSEEGVPHILSAMASILGCAVIVLPENVSEDLCLRMGVLEMTTELGDVSRAIADCFAGNSAGGVDVTSKEAELALEHVGDLERATAKVRYRLEQIARGAPGEQPP